MGELINIRGKRLYVEHAGSNDSPALLYLHGGPGEGIYDFSYFQLERLSQKLRVITMEQRGVLRSDPLYENESFGLDDLVQDCEALRIHFGIKRWSVLGHSFGGYLSVLYGITYPESIDRIIFECPSFDFDLSHRSLLHGAHTELFSSGKVDEANELQSYVTGSYSGDDLIIAFEKAVRSLGSRTGKLYIHDGASIPKSFSIPDEIQKMHEHTHIHRQKLRSEEKIFNSLLPILPLLKHDTLLIKGKYDYVTCDKQLSSYLDSVPKSQYIEFEKSAHHPKAEEPEKYAEVIIDFVSTRE